MRRRASTLNSAKFCLDYGVHFKIRAAILERAEHRCEFCGVPNYAWILRGHGPDAGTFLMINSGAVHDAGHGQFLGHVRSTDFHGHKYTRVILTIAHLDHTPEHNDPANLRALCCRCHLLHAAEHHRQSAYQRRRASKARGDLFDPAPARP